MQAFDPHRLVGRRFRFDGARPAEGLCEIPLHAPAGLPPEEAEAWALRMDLSALDPASLPSLLSEAERDHHQACTHPAVAERYLFSRAVLRSLVGRCLNHDPAALQIGIASGGKPFLETSGAGTGLQFNLSHSGTWLLVALAWNRRVGADIEELRPRPRMMDIAERFYHESERRVLLATEEARRTALFLRGWTLKEAHAKALGVGLRIDLSGTDHSALLNVSSPTFWSGSEAGWWVLPLPPLQGAIATVFVERS